MGYAASMAVKVRPDGTGFLDAYVIDPEGKSAKNISEYVTNGKLKGLIDIRDVVCTDLLQKTNDMARKIIDNVNVVHREGFGIKDFKSASGRDFFESSADQDRTIRDLKISDVIMNSTDAIAAAASPFAPGDNVVANNLLRLREDKILDEGRATLTDFYANMVGVLGLDVKRAEQRNQANEVILADLNKRRESIAGVSLDEEASNLMRWQANFTASSKVITTVDEMLDTVINLKR
jgi:flagellar hook-associated protein 1 FlgK